MPGSDDNTHGDGPAVAPPPAPGPSPSHVVCLGASAGGLEALGAFFDHMPPISGAAFVVVQHLAPDHKSLMGELLARHTEMPVLIADEGTRVQPDTIYLIPPRKNLAIVGGQLRLTEKPHGAPLNLPIDLFLRSLAEDQGERGVAIILSGTGSDGMRGLQAVKAAGGLVLVQEVATAKFDGMPRNALSTGLADYVLPPEAMGAQLVQAMAQTAGSDGASAPPSWATDQESLAALLATIRRQTGIDFSQYKPGTVLRRIERRMHVHQLDKLADYAALVRQSPREVTTLCKEFLISVTKFFRDPEVFESLEKKVIPALLAESGPHETLRVWVPGCATGEEAYTLAILFQEAIEAARRGNDVKIFATDIDREALDHAALGSYPDSIAADIAPARLSRFFIGNGDTFQVSRQLRQSVVFAAHNVAADPPFARLDLISCRNLLIYLEPPLQRRVLATFHFALKPGRHLLLGPSESIGDLATYFRTVDTRHKIFQRTAEVALPLLDALPSESLTTPLVRLARFESLGRASEADVVFDRAIRELVELHAPPSVLLSERLELVHSFGDLQWLLRLPRGEASLNIFAMLPKRVGSVLNLCAQKALRDEVPVRHAAIAYELGEVRGELDLYVRPLQDRRLQSKYLLVEFMRADGGRPAPARVEGIGGAQQAEERRWTELHTELQHAKDNLQATIEELETSNEELQATNEELLSSNEELQSTNEELQSVNEELLTVNAEYQGKIHELSQLTHDIDNLLRSTSVATLFLDENLTIRRFTPDVAAVISLIPRDLGRPIEHFAINLTGVDFFAELRRVVATRQGREHEVVGPDGRCFLMRVLPYMVDGAPTGNVVVTFVEVTRIKDAERRLQWILDSLPEHIAVLDPQGTIVLVNAAWRRFAEENGGALTGTRSVGVGVNYLEVSERAAGETDAARDVAAGLRDVLRGHLSTFRFEYPCDSPSQQRWFVMHAAPLGGPTGGAVVSHIDMTSREPARRPGGAT